VKEDVIAGLNRRFKLNITKVEEYAMKELLNDDEIVIRPADKGSGIVVMDRDEYVRKLQCEMSDSATYEEVPGDRTKTVQNKVKKVVDTLYKKGSIDNELRRYMTGYDGTSGKLQGNPKLHKPGMPLRTIVNGRNHPTEKIAEIVEDELREHVTSLPSYIRDTTDFLNKIKNIPQPLPESTLIFCLDVKALYPSVPRAEARAAVIEALNGRRCCSNDGYRLRKQHDLFQRWTLRADRGDGDRFSPRYELRVNLFRCLGRGTIQEVIPETTGVLPVCRRCVGSVDTRSGRAS